LVGLDRVHCSALDTRRSHLSCWRCTVFEQADAQRRTTQVSRKLKSSNVAAGFRAVGSRTSLRDGLECSIRRHGWPPHPRRCSQQWQHSAGRLLGRRPLPKCQGWIRAQAAAVARTRSRVVGAPRQGGSATRQRRCNWRLFEVSVSKLGIWAKTRGSVVGRAAGRRTTPNYSIHHGRETAEAKVVVLVGNRCFRGRRVMSGELGQVRTQDCILHLDCVVDPSSRATGLRHRGESRDRARPLQRPACDYFFRDCGRGALQR
jgi:hypothetical protein